MTKQKPKASQQLVLSPPGAWGGGKIDDTYLYLALYRNNLKLTIWQHKVQMLNAQMQELINKKESHFLNVELLNIAIQQGQVEKARSLLDINIKEKLSNEAATLLVSSALSAKQYKILNVLITNDKIDLYSLRA